MGAPYSHRPRCPTRWNSWNSWNSWFAWPFSVKWPIPRRYISYIYGAFHSHGGTPKMMLYKGKPHLNLFKWMIWGYPKNFRKPPYFCSSTPRGMNGVTEKPQWPSKWTIDPVVWSWICWRNPSKTKHIPYPDANHGAGIFANICPNKITQSCR